jgi:DNA-binding IclR family transcriptional regulator
MAMARGRGTAQQVDSGAPPPALKVVRRALEVLEYLAVNPGRATDVAQGLKLSWTTVHRTLSQLEQGGFLKRDRDTNRYAIGPRMWFIGTGYLASHPVLEAAQPYLEAAAEGVDYTVQLVERSGRLAVTLYSHHTSGEVITKATYGYHFPLHCGSKGQVLLAHEDPAYIESYLAAPLERLTAESITDPAAVREMLALIRRQGYARTEGDVQAYTGSLAAPVHGRDGRVVAAVCFITRRTRLKTRAVEEKMIEALMRTTQSISMALGWRPDSAGAERNVQRRSARA